MQTGSERGPRGTRPPLCAPASVCARIGTPSPPSCARGCTMPAAPPALPSPFGRGAQHTRKWGTRRPARPPPPRRPARAERGHATPSPSLSQSCGRGAHEGTPPSFAPGPLPRPPCPVRAERGTRGRTALGPSLPIRAEGGRPRAHRSATPLGRLPVRAERAYPPRPFTRKGSTPFAPCALVHTRKWDANARPRRSAPCTRLREREDRAGTPFSPLTPVFAQRTPAPPLQHGAQKRRANGRGVEWEGGAHARTVSGVRTPSCPPCGGPGWRINRGGVAPPRFPHRGDT
ncbi:hypothetical protein EDB83DRAFT_2471989 [Lactarius deliciosus]|nr:hypothetical protein EDB83DRAFT_2471989 [Lactarius deliciosus]